MVNMVLGNRPSACSLRLIVTWRGMSDAKAIKQEAAHSSEASENMCQQLPRFSMSEASGSLKVLRKATTSTCFLLNQNEFLDSTLWMSHRSFLRAVKSPLAIVIDRTLRSSTHGPRANRKGQMPTTTRRRLHVSLRHSHQSGPTLNFRNNFKSFHLKRAEIPRRMMSTQGSPI